MGHGEIHDGGLHNGGCAEGGRTGRWCELFTGPVERDDENWVVGEKNVIRGGNNDDGDARRVLITG